MFTILDREFQATPEHLFYRIEMFLVNCPQPQAITLNRFNKHATFLLDQEIPLGFLTAIPSTEQTTWIGIVANNRYPEFIPVLEVLREYLLSFFNAGNKLENQIRPTDLTIINSLIVDLQVKAREIKDQKHQENNNTFIPESTGWDNLAVGMWRGGYRRDEIADRVKLSPNRITNRLSELRKIYGEEIIPYDKNRKR